MQALQGSKLNPAHKQFWQAVYAEVSAGRYPYALLPKPLTKEDQLFVVEDLYHLCHRFLEKSDRVEAVQMRVLYRRGRPPK